MERIRNHKYIVDVILFVFQWIIAQNGRIVHGMKNEMKVAVGKMNEGYLQCSMQRM